MQKSIKTISFFLFVCISSMFFGQIKTGKPASVIKEKLAFPFGTLVKLKFEIIDGASLKQKSLDGIYMMKIKEVNGNSLKEPFTLEFIDETGEFPTENFALYKKIHRREAENDLSSDEIKKMEKDYVGKTFIVLAYESGKFVGTPEESDYVYKKVHLPRLIKQDVSFQFKNYMVIDSKLSE